MKIWLILKVKSQYSIGSLFASIRAFIRCGKEAKTMGVFMNTITSFLYNSRGTLIIGEHKITIRYAGLAKIPKLLKKSHYICILVDIFDIHNLIFRCILTSLYKISCNYICPLHWSARPSVRPSTFADSLHFYKRHCPMSIHQSLPVGPSCRGQLLFFTI